MWSSALNKLKKLIKKFVSVVVFKPFFLLRTSGLVRGLFNHQAKVLHKSNPPNLTETEQRILRDLKRDGIGIARIDELFLGENILPILEAYAENLKPTGVVDKGKPFLTYLWLGDAAPTWENPFMRLSLSDQMLGIVNSYLGGWSKFFYSSLNITTPVGSKAHAFRSQNWHRDPEDKILCKVFLYLSDVDETAGPFIYIKGSHSNGKWAGVYPQKPPKGSYPPVEVVDKLIPEEETLVCTGKAGTIIFADTSGLHRGGFATHKERLMFTAEFATPSALRPMRYDAQDNLKARLMSSAKYAVSKDERMATIFLNKIGDFAIKHGFVEEIGY